jgi:multiple sugar transport system permease protein
VPRDLVDAARVDGSKRLGVLRHVVLPQLMPVTVFLVIWQTLLSLQLFDLVYATTRGGPLDSTVVVVYYVYKQAFVLFNAGYAAAVAYVVAAFLIALACFQIVYRRLSARHA